MLAETQLKPLGMRVANAAAAALDDLGSSLAAAGDSVQGTAADFEKLTPAVNDATQATEQGAEAAHADETALAGMAEALLAVGEALAVTEALKEFGQEALNAYGTVQSVTIGIAQLTGSAEKANEVIEQIKTLAATQPFAFPEIAPTIQKMIAMGVSTEQLAGVMQAAANASSATGNSFQQVANAIDRMSISGTVGARQLNVLALNTEKLGQVMDVAADGVAKAFKALDQSERLDV